MTGAYVDAWISPKSCFARITQTPQFERVYRFDDGPVNIDYSRLAGAKFMPSARDLNLELLPSPVGWYAKPGSDQVKVCLGDQCLSEKRADRLVELIAGNSYQIYFDQDCRFNFRLVSL